MSPTSEIKIKNIDHLGIVAGLIDEIGIVEIINHQLGIDVREKISSGTLVKSILINGLGFVSRPLYLFRNENLITSPSTQLSELHGNSILANIHQK